MNKPLKIRLHVLSPIHIGCDDVYEPTSFIIDEKKQRLIEFDPIDFVRSLNENQREEFIRVCSKESLLAVIKFIKNNYKPQIGGREVEISPGLLEHYKKVLNLPSFDKKTVINQFTINKTAYNPQNNMPYIPGSSLKGAIRTAYLSKLAQDKGITGWRGKADDLETKLLNRSEGKDKMSSDPFRTLRVSDLLPIGEVKTKIVYAVNRKKEKIGAETLAGRGGVYQIFEIIKPGAIFEGIININKPFENSGISEPIDIENFLTYVHSFYAGNINQEIKPVKEVLKINHQPAIEANSKFKDRFKKDAFLIRIGRHSGAEAVTIEGNRYIKIMQGRDRPSIYLDHATTMWLASDSPKPANNNGLLPFGWAVIELLK